jgi:hypothetical protein
MVTTAARSGETKMNNGLNPKRNASAPEVPQPKKKRGTASPRRKQGVQGSQQNKTQNGSRQQESRSHRANETRQTLDAGEIMSAKWQAHTVSGFVMSRCSRR